jgi:Sep-tRNA:Cys-tRNA synthetase
VTGLIPGATNVWKFNTYVMTKKQAVYLAEAFTGIAHENGLAVQE